MAIPTVTECDGDIFSNTNQSLDGDLFKQGHPPSCNLPGQEWFIGPTLPVLYERALDDEKALYSQLALASKPDPAMAFLDKHAPR